MDSYESDGGSFSFSDASVSDESFSDELSPTDGYFNPRDSSHDTEHQASSSNDTKADEANQTLSETVAFSLLGLGRRTGSYSFSENSPLLDTRPPPPAYSAAIASPYRAPSNQTNDHASAGPSTDYGSTARSRPFDTRRAPESMAELVEIEDGQYETLSRRKRREAWLRGPFCTKILHILIATIGIVLTVLILVLVFTGSWSKVQDVSA